MAVKTLPRKSFLNHRVVFYGTEFAGVPISQPNLPYSRNCRMKCQPETIDDRGVEQRNQERRKPSLKTLQGALTQHRRRNPRRENDHINSYTDWYGHWLLAATFTIIMLCFVDALLTMILLSKGAVELNWLMDYLIQKNIQLFAVVKMSVTGVGLIILVLHFNFRIYKYIAVRYLVYGLVPLYSLLIFHELNMLAKLG